MSLTELRSSLELHEARRNRANLKYKAATRRQRGSRSANYWKHKRYEEQKLVTLRKRQIREQQPPKPKTVPARQRIVNVAELCARNYRRQPGAYHYLAGGVPNTIIDRPTPFRYRSDCSQFAANVYRMAGLACPGSGTFMYSNTTSLAARGRLTYKPKPGDLAFYGSRWNPHHVEVYVGGGRFIGHGTRPIDGLVPGRPSFYINYLGD